MNIDRIEFVYLRLLMLPMDRTRLALQPAMGELRDFIAEVKGQTAEEVQEDFEGRARKAVAGLIGGMGE